MAFAVRSRQLAVFSASAPLNIILQLLIWRVLGMPLFLQAPQGHRAGICEGGWIDVVRFQVGLSQRRADWLIQWFCRQALAGSVVARELLEVLGRLSFAGGPLPWMRPFLGPLCAWAAACPCDAKLRLPAKLQIIFVWLAECLAASRAIPCHKLRPLHLGEAFRVDAKAEGDVVVLGGWSLAEGLDNQKAEWFSNLFASLLRWSFRPPCLELFCSRPLLWVQGVLGRGSCAQRAGWTIRVSQTSWRNA